MSDAPQDPTALHAAASHQQNPSLHNPAAASNYDEFFLKCFEQKSSNPPRPHNYQQRLACGEQGQTPLLQWLGSSGPCESRLINIPTGLGKTAAVIIAWLWNRVHLCSSSWPRRLVYCLPMRTLVEQTSSEAESWLKAHDLLWDGNPETRKGKVGLHILMGGEETDPWDLYPEENAILIGTQDMLLSRALNRGYGSFRPRWPMEFGQLNQDCLWAMDEVQLMDVSLATSAQLQAFRDQDQKAKKQLRTCVTWWMSATLQADWLESADTGSMVAGLKGAVVDIPENARNGDPWKVSKPCKVLSVKHTKNWATKAWEIHLQSAAGEHGRITLIIANTVQTARDLYAELEILCSKAKGETVELRLIHSRFRGMERQMWRSDFLQRSACHSSANRIIVATQVVEAGVDISATTLFSELAPWASLVQRFGRAARYGGSANIFVVDRNPSDKAALPYQLSDLEFSRKALSLLPDASLSGLSAFDSNHSDLHPDLFPYSPTHLLLRRELEELVDTTPDLSGADLDISRFIRSGDERDVQVFWRNVPPHTIPEREIKPSREELCTVSIGDAREWLSKGRAKNNAWVWDYLDGAWRFCRKEDLYPGQRVLVAYQAGGYKISVGWTGEESDRDFEVSDPLIKPSNHRSADAALESEVASQRSWETIAVHGAHVAHVVGAVATEMGLPSAITHILKTCARWHDYGKGHPAFQGCIRPTADDHPGTADLAKAPENAWVSRSQMYRFDGDQRRGFRHELASALALFAVLARHKPDHPALLGRYRELLESLGQMYPESDATLAITPPEQDILDLDQASFDLLAYLICAHHGKVRCAWHVAPTDQVYRARDRRGLPLHGVREGDEIPAIAVTASDGEVYLVPPITLTLGPSRIGLSPRTGASWAERVNGLLDAFGPFSLTYMEAILRAADIRASKSSASETVDTQ